MHLRSDGDAVETIPYNIIFKTLNLKTMQHSAAKEVQIKKNEERLHSNQDKQMIATIAILEDNKNKLFAIR